MTHWVASPHAWTEDELVEYFSVPIEDIPTLPLYDKPPSYIVPDVYPVVKDIKQNLTNGQLIGDEEAHFQCKWVVFLATKGILLDRL